MMNHNGIMLDEQLAVIKTGIRALDSFVEQLSSQSSEKIIQDRIQIVLDDPAMLKVLQKFGGGVFRRSSVFHGLARFLTKQQIKGDVCFEIGSWNGLTALVLSRHFRKVVSVDIAHNDVKWKIAKHVGVTNVEFVDIADNPEKAQVALRTKFDFAFIDGNHADDTQGDFDLVKRCGRVMFHEVWRHQQPVWNLVKSLPESEVTYGGVCFALWRKS